MPNVNELDLPSLHYTDESLVGERFHEVMGELQSKGWVAAVHPLGYVVLDHAAVDKVLRTRRARMPAIEILELQGVTGGPIHELLSGNLINLQGEEHRRLRGLVQAPFLPKSVAGLRPTMRRHLEELFARVESRAVFEFVSAVAKPYPARMIAEIVGAQIDDAPLLGEWAYWIQGVFDPVKVAGQLPRIEAAATEFDVYVRALLDRPGDAEDGTLLSSLRAAVDGGELTADQCSHLVGSVLVGGVDTTQAQLAHTMRLFAEHPDQWEAVVGDASLVPAAVEEALRFEPIAPFTARLVTEDLEHDGVVFPAGTVLFACALTANRDPAVFADPDRFDITADRGDAKLLSFGAGPHFCLGAALARAELEEAVAFLAERMPTLELAGQARYDTPAGVYGLLELPLRFTARNTGE